MTSINSIQQDQLQRQQALQPDESFIVQAPAGSGKTELIIQRFLTLLSHVNNPEEILAITFTKKSAHEMRTRVLKALEQASHEPEPLKPHERLTWQLATNVLKQDGKLKWNLIQNPNQLHIKTIDSFCTYLTGQLPLLSHFGSQPSITNFAQTLYREAVVEVLSHVEESHAWSPAVAKLLAHTDNDLNRLASLLMKMLEKRDQWQRYLNLDMNNKAIRSQLTQQISDVIDFTLNNARDRLPSAHTDELLSLLTFTTGQVDLSLEESDFSLWQQIANLLLTKANEWRKQANEESGFLKLGDLKGDELKVNRAMRARHKALLEALTGEENFRATLETIRRLPQNGYTDAQWEALQALLEVLKITLAQLRVTFQAAGEIDFIENAWGATLALGDETHPTDLALSLDYQIRHVLVDEFQDTSFPQHRLLEMLTHGWQQGDGRSLFVVGDPMQSIYRFRQAEVGLFIRMQQQGIGDIHLTPLTLAVNFRSTNQIVEWNNQHFDTIFPNYSDIGSGAVHFSQSIAHLAANESNESSVTAKGFLEGDQAVLGAATITYIQETLAQWPHEKIAILVRSRSHLSAIVPALKAAQLRYNAVSIDPLITRQSIQDLLALTRALIHPADRIAWLAVLRAPWCGLSLSDLLALCGQERQRTLWEQLNNSTVIATLSADGQQRIASLLPALQSAINHRERSALRQWIEQTWLALGGPATLNDYEEMADIEEFFTLMEELSSQSERINLERLNERMTKLHASTHHDDAPIQIMTIHSAKGLEFDTVILPHLEKPNPQDDKTLMHWVEHPLEDDKISLLLAPIHASDSDADPLYRYIENFQKVKSHFEIDRLLYVAATRAKKRLHLLFNLKDKEKGGSNGSFLHKLWPLIKNKAVIIEKNDETDSAAEKPLAKSRSIARFTNNWVHPVVNQQPTGNTSQQTHSGFRLQDQSARLIGTITHSIFQQLSISGIAWWQSQSHASQETYIKRELLRAGLSIDLHQQAIESIQTITARTLADERGQWILKAHQAAQSEFRLTAQLGNGIENLIIDRTFVDTDNIRWIIDYKTAVNQDESLAVFLAKQKEKYKKQMTKYQQAIQQMDNRTVKLGLYFPAVTAWCEW